MLRFRCFRFGVDFLHPDNNHLSYIATCILFV